MIKIAETDEEIRKCFPVMAELRPHFTDETEFVEQVRRQMKNDKFQLVFLEDSGVKAVGGIRIGEWLARGKYLEIEDLVTKSDARSKNYGGKVFDWIEDYARRENCREIKLVSHVMRFGAHKFYLNKKMILDAHFFSKEI
ncbi:MAG TPA: GNAT family N-acetyltransferase [Pyrinomonadaceae bacterium]|nr:GNAT family N-acetyltransferase [Pyrinomonadaceae bacterium]